MALRTNGTERLQLGRPVVIYRLSEPERQYVNELLAWDSAFRKVEALLCQISLVVGGSLIVGTAVFTLDDLSDRTIFTTLVPGFIAGIFFIGMYAFGQKRIRDRHRVARILRKVRDPF